ncbi:MAG: VIT1/CCC1 transporter family protein [Methylobacter sp.]
MKKHLMLHILRAQSIARRYLITNGFDGALTMLGMVTGFYTSGMTELSVAISACLGAAVALFISGLSSAYLSEKAEREKELRELEQALVTDLKESDYGQASRYLPILVALVNGLSPLLLSLVILLPLFFAEQIHALPSSPFINAIVVALICIFFLGIFLGKISKTFWLWSGLRTLFIAMATVAIILLFGRHT